MIVIGESQIEEQLEKAMAHANKLIEKQLTPTQTSSSARSTRRHERARLRVFQIGAPGVRHLLPAAHHRPASAAIRPDATAACKAS